MLQLDDAWGVARGRRGVLQAAVAAALWLPPAAAWRAQPAAAAGPGAAAAESPRTGELSSVDFYARWPYMQPADILPFIRQQAAPGDAAAVLAAMDEWARCGWPQARAGRG
jgi:hypothetical protein